GLNLMKVHAADILLADMKRIAPSRRPSDVDRVRRHLPAARALSLDADRLRLMRPPLISEPGHDLRFSMAVRTRASSASYVSSSGHAIRPRNSFCPFHVVASTFASVASAMIAFHCSTYCAGVG